MKRATLYLEDSIHKAIKLKSAECSATMSELVNDVLKNALSEDLEDLRAFEDRQSEPTISFEAFLKKMKTDGLL